MSKLGRVLVAMSGGVDSSVAAILLHEMGYEVIGMTMKTWSHHESTSTSKETGCCTLDSINDARELAVKMNFPHYVLDIRSEFVNFVIDNFVEEYLAGRTPNPCIMCNTHIKWDALMKRANLLDCEFVATGHYAKLRKNNNRYFVAKGLDINKDQSYVLWGLSQKNLSRTIFPLENLTKPEIRQIALDKNFINISNKKDSYEICFIPNNDYRSFIKKRVPNHKFKKGKFILSSGEVVGEHKGHPFYTIGQRKGLDLAIGKPIFVKNIIPETNTIILGEENELKSTEMIVRGFNPMKYENIDGTMEAVTKIRYNNAGALSQITQNGDTVEVNFLSEVKAITPGQSAVFYEQDEVIGGGFIAKEECMEV